MNVEIDINVICPGCGCVMTRFGDCVACCTRDCDNYGKKFKKPKFVLYEIGKEESEVNIYTEPEYSQARKALNNDPRR